jgi:hypothetical protein
MTEYVLFEKRTRFCLSACGHVSLFEVDAGVLEVPQMTSDLGVTLVNNRSSGCSIEWTCSDSVILTIALEHNDRFVLPNNKKSKTMTKTNPKQENAKFFLIFKPNQ